MAYKGHAHPVWFGMNPAQAGHWKSHRGLCLAGHGTPRDLADVAVDAVLSMDGQPAVLQQSAVLAGIISVRQVYDQQVWVAEVLWKKLDKIKQGVDLQHRIWVVSVALTEVG